MQNLPRKLALFFGFVTVTLTCAKFSNAMGWIAIEADALDPALAIVVAITSLSAVIWQRSKSDTDSPPRSDRDILIDTVQQDWIEGVLKDALRDAQFGLAAQPKPDYAGDVRNPDYAVPVQHTPEPTIMQKLMRTILRQGDDKTESLENVAQTIPQIFEDVDRKLLILGAPGSGKTVLMLQLAEYLLNQAQDTDKSIPIVFNLSSWAENRQPLDEWLIDELNQICTFVGVVRCDDPGRSRRIAPTTMSIFELVSRLYHRSAPVDGGISNMLSQYNR